MDTRTRETGSVLRLVSAFSGTFMALLDLTIVNVAAPSIQADLNTDLAGLQWVVDGFALALAALMLSGGSLGDRYGRKRVFLSGLGVFVVASVLCALAPTLAVLVAGRCLQGAAAAVIVPGALSLIGQAVPDPRDRARVMGYWGMAGALAVIAGPLLGGLLVDTLGWPSIFLVNVPVGLAAIVIGLRAIPESADPRHAALDPAGQVLVIGALAALSYGVIEARSHGWESWITIGSLTAAVLAAVLVPLVERRVIRPLLPLGLFRDARFTITNLASVALGFAANGGFFLLSALYLQQLRGHSAMETGLALLPMTLSVLPASLVAGRLNAAHGPRLPMLTGYVLTGAALAAMTVFDAGTPYPVVAVLFVVAGVGQGLAITPAAAAVLETVPLERSGIAAATVNTARQVGTALGVAVLGTIVAESRDPVHGMQVSLLVAGAVTLAAAALLAVRWRAPERPPAEQVPASEPVAD
ncbi:DHA2 family efflux MFS transporter permease subunit [Nonomuraea sp. NPDC005650]|uniref:DHA2 family efflux MFS transporter permease subunit n=1 Tax=Nonomuraea sp. NPDC005650 TaxID=3157045 RepID=UPI0033BDDEA8